MGQAKQRGSFEQRQQAAQEREDALSVQREANLKRLEEADELATQRTSQMLSYAVQRTLKQAERSTPIMTAAWSLVEGFGKVASSDVIKAEVKKVVEADLAAMATTAGI